MCELIIISAFSIILVIQVRKLNFEIYFFCIWLEQFKFV